MPTEFRQTELNADTAAGALETVRRFEGSGIEFWRLLASAYAGIAGALRVLVLRQQPETNGDWNQLVLYSNQRGGADAVQLFLERSRQAATECVSHGRSVREPLPTSPVGDQWVIAVRLQVSGATHPVIATALVQCDDREASAVVRMLELASDLPERWQEQRALARAREDVECISRSLDLQLELNDRNQFLAAAMALCNTLASTHRLDRVSLGWLDRGMIRLKAISRVGKINRKMEAAQLLEAAMEESLDQDAEVVFPPEADASVVCRDHERYAREQGVNAVCSFPLRCRGENVAALLCERKDDTITGATIREIRHALDVVSTRLADLQEHDRWFGARWSDGIKRFGGRLVGHEHTWAKIISLTLVALLAVLIFWKVDHRVEGTFQLRSERVAIHAVPFDGFIADARFRPGDIVEEGELLVALDTRDLLLEQASARADERQYLRAVEKNQAEGNLADMRIAMSQLEQTRSRLERLDYRLGLSSIRSTLSGVIVEGDLRDRLGAPVSQGDGLLKVAQLADLFVEAEIGENDVHLVSENATGEIAFISQPQMKFPIRVIRIEPMAVPDQEGNHFVVRCRMEGVPADWWRPGMTGTAKLDAGQRSLMWIGTRRTVDFLRMFFWW